MKTKILSIILGIPALMLAFGEPKDPANFGAFAVQILAMGVLVGIVAINKAAFNKGVR